VNMTRDPADTMSTTNGGSKSDDENENDDQMDNTVQGANGPIGAVAPTNHNGNNNKRKHKYKKKQKDKTSCVTSVEHGDDDETQVHGDENRLLPPVQ